MPASVTAEPDPLWMKPSRAYNLHAEVGPGCLERFTELQRSFHRAGTVVCPPESLHLSVATLLSVREDYGAPKDLIWSRWGAEWVEDLRALAGSLRPFEVNFNSLRVSQAAVFAAASPVQEVDQLRARAAELLGRAGLKADQPSILHCTLLRYDSSAVDLVALERSARETELNVTTLLTSLVIFKVFVYPNLVREVIDRLQLGAGAAPPERS
ncbi:MAG TPA: 2'-5' RNA ligase family protein [Acidimicrobiales bacterium]|nr:2'-5' RNA ligase family protein [Acidimicrobiales bacterium]